GLKEDLVQDDHQEDEDANLNKEAAIDVYHASLLFPYTARPYVALFSTVKYPIFLAFIRTL
ncbi:MAG TPA: hypothetical protein VGB29_03070, partial [Thermodesulfobacteriota bacterium]